MSMFPEKTGGGGRGEVGGSGEKETLAGWLAFHRTVTLSAASGRQGARMALSRKS